MRSPWDSFRASAVIAVALAMAVLAAPTPTVAATSTRMVAPKPSAGCSKNKTVSVAPGEEQVNITSGGVDRSYIRNVPPRYPPNTPMPIVVQLHGAGQQARVASFAEQTGLEAYGNQRGFITLLPIATAAGYFLPLVDASPDVTYISDLLDEVERQLCVDERRAYVTGISMGATFSSTLACALPDRFAAAAPISGVFLPTWCKASARARVPVVVFHGTADRNNPYDGVPRPDGSSDLSLPPSLKGAPPVPAVTTAWAKLNGCSDKTSDTPIGSDVHLVKYQCAKGAEVELYRIDGGGHTWPGVPNSGIGPSTATISADQVMWDFFRQHPLRAHE